MKISTNNIDFEVKIINENYSTIPLVFIHGFMGTMKTWNDIVSTLNTSIILIDAPGHGNSKIKNEFYSFPIWCEDFKLLLDELKLDKINLCGYSMGGRLAISFASKYPQKINKLILESSTPGIKDEKNRTDRIAEDNQNIKMIKNDYSKFLKKWRNRPLFSKQRDRNRLGLEMLKEIQANQNIDQLVLSLKYLGVGEMLPLWDSIDKFNFPVMILTGSEDSKYCRIAINCLQFIPDAKWVNISNCNHNIHLEQKTEFIESLKSFIY